ncbi:uncharacterized protein LOC122350806 isoform X2 [Puntigrus tetrazona]|uniref:uncharacterized protein LOC122350806 isoform X2 n=1 Tax=Puntigrus tetrazona TaxID=1606681 RepID=UPI001C893DB3|nr:uncharacterized protein LOC122350806 isoform X2 [Puntigrus tetrazona]
MRFSIYTQYIICGVFLVGGAVSGEEVKKAVGETVSFLPENVKPPVTITWKQISDSGTVKAIEWDNDDQKYYKPHPRFSDATSLNKDTGAITIANLKLEHSGTYIIDINSKEQKQRFTLKVMERVPRPEITKDNSNNPDVVYLKCEYNEMIIWNNSTGVLEDQNNKKEISVKKTGNAENFYTCTFKNDVSEETSDRMYERDLFEDTSDENREACDRPNSYDCQGSNAGLVIGIIVAVILILIIIGLICAYLLNASFHNCVNDCCPFLKSLGCLECCAKYRKQYSPAPAKDDGKTDAEDGQGNSLKEVSVPNGDEPKEETASPE